MILKDQNKNWSELKEPQNSKDDKVKNLIEILYNKINSVADSTKKFLNSAEKLSRYCEFSKNEAKLDLRNYQSEKSNIESELNNLVNPKFQNFQNFYLFFIYNLKELRIKLCG